MSDTEAGTSDSLRFTKARRNRRIRRILVCLVLLLLCAAAGIGITANWALQKTRVVPEFYVQAAQRMPSNVVEASRELEIEVEELTAQVGQLGSWQATFTEAQINAWLEHQLPQELARILPAGVEQPRVVFQAGKILAAAQFKDKRLETVVSFEVGVQLTAEPNVLAIEVRELKAGALSLPLGRFVDHISNRAARDDLEIRWDKNDAGFPIALVTVPSEHASYVRSPVTVESVTMSEGNIRLAGHTGPEAIVSYQPRGPVYKLASHRTPRSRHQ